MDANEQKRASERRTMFKVVKYSIEGRSYVDLSTNISERGMFIKNTNPPLVGTRVTVVVKLPEEWGGLPLSLVGEVAHVDDDPDPHKRGMGLRFISVEADAVPIIEYFLGEVYKEELEPGCLTESCQEVEDLDITFQPEPTLPATISTLGQGSLPVAPAVAGPKPPPLPPGASSGPKRTVFKYDLSKSQPPTTSYHFIRKKTKS